MAPRVVTPGVGKAMLIALVAGGSLQLCGQLQDRVAGAFSVHPREIEQVLRHAQL
jgi:hypothetical protein